VDDQGQCGDCWAFAAAGLLESFYSIKTGLPPVKISKQQLLDCTNPVTGSQGSCNGGHYFFASTYVSQGTPLSLESAYSYQGVQNPTCKVLTAGVPQLIGALPNFFSSVNIVSQLGPSDLYAMLQKGPVAVNIDAMQDAFMNYSSGVLNYTCGTAPNHAVLLVGYGFDVPSNSNYWVIRNSWGPGWGLNGYVNVLQNATWNSCWIYKNAVNIS